MTTKPKKIRVFETAIEKLGRILSQKWGINIVFKANECRTDGKTICLPVLPDDASQELLDVTHGYVDHEAAHVIFSDFKVGKGLEAKLFACLNVLEDVRAEREMSELWAGTAHNLRRTTEWTLRKLSAEQDDGCVWSHISDFSKAVTAAYVFGFAGFDKTHWFLSTVVEPDILDKVVSCEAIIREAAAAANTGQVLDCAKRFLHALGEKEEKEEKQPAESNEYWGEGKADSVPDWMLSPDEMAERIKARIPDVKSQPRSYEATEAELQQDAALLAVSEMLRSAVASTTTQDGYSIYTTEGDVVVPIKDGDRVQYRKFMLNARSTVAVMRRKLSRSMLSSSNSRWEGGKTRGKINPRSVYQVCLGTSKHVFRQKVEAEHLDTVIQIMIDHSGSMNSGKLKLAAETTVVLGEIAHQLNIPFSVLGFSTDDGSIADKRFATATPAAKEQYTRWGNHWIGQYKEFDELWGNTNHRLLDMQNHQHHNTYDGESLRLGAQRLLRRKEKRKILFWLNDGQPCPNNADNIAAHTAYVRACAVEVERHVELVAVGIMTDAVRDFYSHHVIVNSLKDLPGACLNQLDTLLRKGKVSRHKKAA